METRACQRGSDPDVTQHGIITTGRSIKVNLDNASMSPRDVLDKAVIRESGQAEIS